MNRNKNVSCSYVSLANLGSDKLRPSHFNSVLLPQLALHYRREKLTALEMQHPWLKSFHVTEPRWIEAREYFFKHGTDCIAVVETHVELVDLMLGNELLTMYYGSSHILFMAELYKELKYYDNSTNRDLEQGEDPVYNLSHDLNAQKEKLASESGSDQVYYSFLESAEEFQGQLPSQIQEEKIAIDQVFKAFTRATPCADDEWSRERLAKMESWYANALETAAIKIYKANLKNFVYYVGCPEAHDDPQKNIAELRKFHATQMPFFQKLQDDLQAQINLNKEQQEIITALVFRHLIENLPPNPYKGKTSATDRWLAFWEDAVRNEYENTTYHRDDTSGNPQETDHPLRGLINDKVFTKLTQGQSANGKYPAKRGVGAGEQNFDRDPQGKIDEVGEKAQMYRWGKELFGLLSKNIHAYEAKGMEGYQVEDDHWGKGFRDILKRLKPVEYDVVGDESVVNWEEERKRYIDQTKLRPVDPEDFVLSGVPDTATAS